MTPRTPVNALPTVTAGLCLVRTTEQYAYLVGPRAVVAEIAAASGLDARDCVHEGALRIEHADEAVLRDAAARAGHPDVRWGCTLCEAARSGTCHVHQRAVKS